MIYIYAVGERGEVPAGMTGLDERPVAAVAAGELTAYASFELDAGVEPRPDDLWRHDRVVGVLSERAALLPMRFGTVVADEDALRRLLDGRRDELLRALANVRGRVELGVRALWRERPPAPPPRDGRAFMYAKLARRGAARRAAAANHSALARLSADSRVRLLPDDDSAYAAAYLVERSRAPDVAARAEAMRDADADVRLQVSGPWPPYSFCEVTDD